MNDPLHFVAIMRLGGWRQKPFEVPRQIESWCKFNPQSKRFTIEGNFGECPLDSISAQLTRQKVTLLDPLWELRMGGNPEHATGWAIERSIHAANRAIGLLNPDTDYVASECSEDFKTLKAESTPNLSTVPEGSFSRIGNHLFVSTQIAERLNLENGQPVHVDHSPVEFLRLDLKQGSTLNPELSFTKTWNRFEIPFRNLLGYISNSNTVQATGLSEDKEGWGDFDAGRVFMIDSQTVSDLNDEGLLPGNDTDLLPVYPDESPEGELVCSLVNCLEPVLPQN